MAEMKNTNSTGQAMMRMMSGIAVLVVLTALLYFAAPDSFYLWAKGIHILAVISWMAGMLYLPRLLVYHADAEKGSVQSETFKVMERRLLRGIINPAMIVTWVFGLWLAWKGFGFQGGWLHAKIGAVLLLSAMHGYLSGAVRKFAEDRNEKPARHWRMVNEIPTLLMIAIVILVVVKPF
ncbi:MULTISPECIES: protoporphyrinogen oxidase HemJ [unclassified Mesorhizobium]|uniref:protoporphyrinogen oxidase HemJ n=1 Tax=unclassified Mesorhizobium TaxID=325217 RepID=UPI000FCBD74A|nr:MULTISPECIES: protoporphyrinogen oxidase HemJ [unclassified Mesorhizobium]RUU62446.1 protoporphyrinogen oxidase HemJ [Mesorhizobium sp. M7A.T.Ca.TU.009.01.1.1]RUU75724.1 protoporphyrinogen oxidase HemJ [Mesorhizobium sp. M7A.T.Ca.TU.009.01.1.2]RUT89084.1 protoporphyrinogen oxidase HemJ [Mesorhizobium sp. M7A.T.Ca.US.000.02.1.1]RUT93045.1 protoporphyrinogen oxidase HemJ [Mesorhizobium sp. M7A.T.Ca.US.000.02.2.1]RUU02505.1 protoporphyrinogen oxidase HemJ [Mesorhizobium sp. M7A.T.Ca.TU.009.02.